MFWFWKAPESLSQLSTWSCVKLIAACVILAYVLPVVEVYVGMALTGPLFRLTVGIMLKNVAAFTSATAWDWHQDPPFASLSSDEWRFLNRWSWIEFYSMLVPLAIIPLLFMVRETRDLLDRWTPLLKGPPPPNRP